MKRAILQESAYETALALVGMSGRFPGAATVEAFWHNIASGISSIRPLSDDELLAAGVDPALLTAPNYVKAGSVLEGIADFDASFFGYTPREAEVMDPQHRLFLECCWEALERAGYDPGRFAGLVGVFAGSGFNHYMAHHLYPREDLRETVGQLQMDVGNERDSLASTVSYKLDLRGPALGVQTFCSSSLVAVHLAAQSLLNYECDLALAGGVALSLQQPTGYHYEPGGILSPDGLCRALDGKAQGSVMGSGVGVVVLKRLADALEQGDQLYAILRGSAVNNDGRRRVSYTAPGVDGQAAVIAAAQSYAGVSPQSIGYVETHGTGTPLGDAVELEAMKKAFGEQQREARCALGSVKPNIGHLDRASGVTGLIKATQALWHRQLPPSLNYEGSSRELQLEQSGFWVNTQLQAWPEAAEPRRAGVSSFGLGGTNAHVVLEEAPEREAGTPSRDWQLLLLSGRSEQAVEQMGKRLGEHLKQEEGQALADVAYTLQVGRSEFAWREVVLCRNRQEAIAQLESTQTRLRACVSQRNCPVAFVLPGENALPLSAIRELYQVEERFREAFEHCCNLLSPDTRKEIYNAILDERIQHVQHMHAYTFMSAYALAQLLISWGIRPQYLAGAGSGALVAACLSGVFSAEEALRIISADEPHTLQLTLHAPQIPCISTETGHWLTHEQAADPGYWTNVLTKPIQSLHTPLLEKQGCVLLVMSAVLASSDLEHKTGVIMALQPEWEGMNGQGALLACLGRLWQAGVSIDWSGFYAHEQRLRVLLPTYPFERQRYWIEDPRTQRRLEQLPQAARGTEALKQNDSAHWFYRPAWQETPLPVSASPFRAVKGGPYLVFCTADGPGMQLAARLEALGEVAITIQAGTQFARLDERTYALSPGSESDYMRLSQELAASQLTPLTIIHCWSASTGSATGQEAFAVAQEMGLYSLISLVQAFAAHWQNAQVRMLVVSAGMHAIGEHEYIQAEKITALAACTVIAQEHLNILCRQLDLAPQLEAQHASEIMLQELDASLTERIVAYRHGRRWIQTYQRLELVPEQDGELREQGVYLIIGGLGSIGLALAEHLARAVHGRLVLLGRSALPPREEWAEWLHGRHEQHEITRKIQSIQHIEALGAQVLLCQADVANEAEMQSVVAQTMQHYGALHGVIHAAAVSQPEAFVPIQKMRREICAWHFQSKVYGLYVLERVLQDQPLDFCLLFSSISSVLGGLGFSGYAAANQFMDAFVARHNQLSAAVPWLSINWDTWQLRQEAAGGLGGSVAPFAMSREEGLAVFERLLTWRAGSPVIISTGDLQARIRQWVLLESARVESNSRAATMPLSAGYEQVLVSIWQQVLGIEHVGLYDNFFDVGGNSLTALQVIAAIRKAFAIQLPVATLFESPTISALLRVLQPEHTESKREHHKPKQRRLKHDGAHEDIAIIGLTGRFPGAANVEEFWHNLREGRESITLFSDEELRASGVPEEQLRDPAYVRARPILTAEQVEGFDADFFEYTPREAQLMDPQHRLFLECCWEALELAGYDPLRYQGAIGVFGGANISSYLHSLLKQPELLASLQDVVNEAQAMIGMDKDSLTSTVSYKLNLKGPSFAVQTFCSTSLVATHLACQSLRNGECDLALAGGVSVRVPYKAGHLYEPGGMNSPDGHSRTFDAQAQGGAMGDGVGIVVFKRLSEALAAGDTIHAIIKGSAINNDGSLRVSYTAPGVAGQSEVVMAALEAAGVSAESIDYIEAHGTATALGDPIEVAALTKAFRSQTEREGYCALGSVKTNVGHLDRAAGVTGLIKTVLALENEELPASLHYTGPNAQIDFARSPFYVNAQLIPWRRGEKPRRAGISSFGMGGTNAHVIVEEAPLARSGSPSRPWQLLLLSAKTATALDDATNNLYRFLDPDVSLPDVAYTLQVGRATFDHRRMVLCQDVQSARHALQTKEVERLRTRQQQRRDQAVVFLFPPAHAVRVSQTRELYELEPAFRSSIEDCAAILQRRMGVDLLAALYGPGSTSAARYTQVISFAIEYALAHLLMQWGIRPQALLGHGSGEYVAACIAGIFSLEDALVLQAADCKQKSCATPALQLSSPVIPMLSGKTGGWLSAEEALNSAHWLLPDAEDSRLAASVECLLQETEGVILEVGFEQSLSTLIRQHTLCQGERRAQVFSTCPSSSNEPHAEQYALLTLLGELWQAGVAIDWSGFYAHETRRRIPLPTYPFERKRYWLGGAPSVPAQVLGAKAAKTNKRGSEVSSWFYRPAWEQVDLAVNEVKATAKTWLIFLDEHGLGQELASCLLERGHNVVCVRPGERMAQLETKLFSIRPGEADDYIAMLQILQASDLLPSTILHCWGISAGSSIPEGSASFAQAQECGFYSLLQLAKALGRYDEERRLLYLCNTIQAVTGAEEIRAEKAPALAACKVISQEYPSLRCSSLDIEFDGSLPASRVEAIVEECLSPVFTPVVAHRAGKRWVEVYTAPPVSAEPGERGQGFRQHGVYVITGGLGNIGLELASYLGQTYQARLVLVGRSAFPQRELWENWLEQHDPGDRISRAIQRLRAIEQYGGRIVYIQADVANERQMTDMLQHTLDAFGTLHGVIHAAGITSGEVFKPIERLERRACETQFQAKVHGLFVLERVLQPIHLDFCLLFSSLSAVLGGLSMAAYAGANLFIDAYVNRHNQLPGAARWLSVDWDTWQVKEDAHGALGGSLAGFAMTPQEACTALEFALQTNVPRLVNSTGDLEARLAQWVLLNSLQESREEAGEAEDHSNLTPDAAELERCVKEAWEKVLGVAQIGREDNFFDLGGNSLTGLQLIALLKKMLRVSLPAVALYEAPSISAMLRYLQVRLQAPGEARHVQPAGSKQHEIAIIGMSGRFPGASSIERFWENLSLGRESITFFSDEELLAAGVAPMQLKAKNYVKARPVLEPGVVEQFDAAFFGYSPREAEVMDPQHRLFLECCWEALEQGGYDPYGYEGAIGVFGGTNISTYILAQNPGQLAQINTYQLLAGNDKDSLTSSVSYKLNLRGPSLAVQTFCSTSLVATHLACQSLRSGECDMALAGGVSIRVPMQGGHLYEEGSMESPDGHSRTFDARAKGTMFGDGVGVVVLKRLEDALRDGDVIHALIKGSAVNNDGSLKVSYSAPSIAGQSQVIGRALADAGVSAEEISYVEAHGSATELGDPIEVAALTKAFRTQSAAQGYCALGSVKTNVGHLDRASGVTGLIKAALALKYEAVPASLHFEEPNPEIDFEHSPFYVNRALRPWPRGERRRFASVNSLGMGGTNAHMVLAEAPIQASSGPSRPWQVLLLSARTRTALDAMRCNLSTYLLHHPEAALADIAYTLQVGRKRFEQRYALICSDRQSAIATLNTAEPAYSSSRFDPQTERSVAFLLPGVGELYPGMISSLYREEPVFRAALDQCCELLKAHMQLDIRDLLFAPDGPDEKIGMSRESRKKTESSAQFKRTELAQPATFVIEYALAQLLMQWGLQPEALLGYSLGEYVAACLAGVFSLEDALSVVARRAQWIQALPGGAMLAVALSEEEAQAYLDAEVGLAAVNSPTSCTLAGSYEAIAQLETKLRDIAHLRVETTHAFHCAHLYPLKDALRELMASIPLHAPQIPYLSNVTGTWITPEQATDPAYWARHMCETVRFSDGVGLLLQKSESLLLEVGPGHGLSSFAKQHPACERERAYMILPTLPSLYERQPDQAFLLSTLGKLWSLGVRIDWAGFYRSEQRRRVSLPTYPFERQRYWLEPGPTVSHEELPKVSDVADWFYLPSWRQAPRIEERDPFTCLSDARTWLLLVDAHGIGTQLAHLLRQHGQHVVEVLPGTRFVQMSKERYMVRPEQRSDYQALLLELARSSGGAPECVVHLWTLGPQRGDAEDTLKLGFYSLLALTQALGDHASTGCTISSISSSVYNIAGNELIDPLKATLLGPSRVIPQEYEALHTRFIDMSLNSVETCSEAEIRALFEEIIVDSNEPVVALRGGRRWLPDYETLRLEGKRHTRLRHGGVYLITGGLGGIGLALAEYLAHSLQAKLILVGRTALPPRSTWPDVLSTTNTSVQEDIARRIRAIQRIEEAAGTQLLLLHADVTDEVQMAGVVEKTLAMFGALHGVLHCAGVPGEGLIQLKKPEVTAQVLAPKIQGTLVLARVLRGLPLDFLALFSSITSITGGGPGQVDYCAANAFLDAYACSHTHEHGYTVAIDWSEWQWNAWDAGLNGYGSEAQAFLRENRRRFGISFEEGAEALRRILSSRLAQVIVATQDFRVVAQQSRSFTAQEVLRRTRELRSSSHIRPELASSYVAPGSSLEQSLAEVWEELLGIAKIGIHDNFFELGGNSLLGLDLVAQLKKRSPIQSLPAYVLYEAPTISALALYIEREQAGKQLEDEVVVGRQLRGERRREGLKQRTREMRRKGNESA